MFLGSISKSSLPSVLNIFISVWISDSELQWKLSQFLNRAYQYFEPPWLLKPKVTFGFCFPWFIQTPISWTTQLSNPIFIFLRGSQNLDSSVFQSYSYRSTSPRVSVGCASIVVAFFLLVIGGILVTVYKHKNEQKGKL